MTGGNEAPAATLSLRPAGSLTIGEGAGLIAQIRASEGEVELDLSQVESMDLSIVQLIVATAASLRQHGRGIVVIDSDHGVLRSLLELAGIRPALAGLSARLML